MTHGSVARRRLFRFSLRFLAIVVTVFTVWFGLTANRANRQRRAVERIEGDGGQFWYDYQVVASPGNTVGFREIDPDKPPPGPAWLRGLLHQHYFVTPIDLHIRDCRLIESENLALLADLPELEELSFGRMRLERADLAVLPPLARLRSFRIEPSYLPSEIGLKDFSFLRGFPRLQELGLDFSLFDDDDAEHLTRVSGLRRLGLGYTQLGDDGVRHLRELKNLERLNLAGTKITDAGLIHLEALSKLRYLDLSKTAITDEGLKRLLSLPVLEHLFLIDTSITDVGLQRLESIATLKRIEVIGAPITDEGVAGFLQVLPTCRVRVNWGR